MKTEHHHLPQQQTTENSAAHLNGPQTSKTSPKHGVTNMATPDVQYLRLLVQTTDSLNFVLINRPPVSAHIGYNLPIFYLIYNYFRNY